MKKHLAWGVATIVDKNQVTTVAGSKLAAEKMNQVGFEGKGKVVRVMVLG